MIRLEEVIVVIGSQFSDNTLVGDAQNMSGHAHGGDDTLTSGTGNDKMWGDAQVIWAPLRAVTTRSFFELTMPTM